MANEFVVRKGLIVSGSTEVENAVIARSITGSFSGSISAPGSNTQVVFNNAGTLAADSGLVYSSGNVGIGTTSPTEKLDVLGTTRLNGLQTLQGTVASDTAPLGAELLTTGTGDASWTGTSFATGYIHTTGSVTALTSTLAGVIGTFYQIDYTITGRTAGSITIAFGGSSTAGITATRAVGPLATTTGTLVVTPTTDFNGTLVLSIKTIGTSSATTTFLNSAGTISNEIRVSNITTNTFIGVNAGRRNTTGDNNTAIGREALRSNTTGFNNTANGVSALFSNTTGVNNTANGLSALRSNTTGVNNTANGLQALLNNTTGNNNTASGVYALRSNTTGAFNTANGLSALLNNTTGGNNTASGVYALRNNTTGNNNTASGFYALRSNTTGVNNTASGFYALRSNTTGVNNTANGLQALLNNTTGGSNTANGVNALLNNTTGAFNTANGRDAGRFIADGTTANTAPNNSIFLGFNTKALADNQTNQIVIGHEVTGLGSNTTVLGNTSTLTTALYGNVGIGTTTPSAVLHISGASSANLLRIDSPASSSILVVSGSGNVGIGTTAPDSKLHVVGTVKFQDDLTISGSSPAITLRETGAGTGDAIIVIAGQRMTVYTGRTGTSRNDFWLRVGDAAVNSTPAIFTSGSNGFTGLGTETPNERLEVAGNVRLPNSGRVYLWRDNNSNYIDNINWIASSGTTQTIQNTGVGGITFKTLTDTRMFISSSGNVGIGTTSPSDNLHVKQDQNGVTQLRVENATNGTNSRASIAVGAPGNALTMARYLSNYTAVPDLANKGLLVTDSGLTGGFLFRTTAGPVAFQPAGNTDRVVFAADGNVGIGTTSPSQKLTVAGDALITGSLTVQGTITAKEFKTEFVSASITYVSGSHKFGDTADDIHQFTGSVFVNGPLTATSLTGSFSGSVSGPVTAPGSDTQIVFNNAGLLSANSGLVYSGSNVGIGTTAPAQKLDVNGVIRTPQMSIGGLDSGRNQFLTYTSGPVFRMLSTGGSYASLGIGTLSIGTSYASISGSQNTVLIEGTVGIGTTSPSYKLSIVGAAGQQLELIDSTTSKSWRPNVNGSDFYITETAVDNPFVIKAGGNVGIGTTAPTQKLDISGNTQVSGQFAQGVTVANKLVGYGAEFRSNGASAQIVFGRDGSSVGSGAIGADLNHSFAVFTTSSFTKQFVVTQAGTVGIGTTSPSTTLNVVGSTGDFKLERTGFTSFVQLGLPSGVPTIVGNGNLALGGNGAYTTHLFISASGNVGVDTTTPTTKLEVSSPSYDGLTLSRTVQSAGSFIQGRSYDTSNVLRTSGRIVFGGIAASNASNGFIALNTCSSNIETERMRVTSAGNVGIGTTSPGAKLQIGNGTSNSPSSVAVLSADGGNAVLNALSLVNSRVAANGNGTSINFHNANNYGATGRIVNVLDSGTNASLRFSVYNSTDDALVEKVTLLSSGNVGIGTTTPSERLHVSGSIRVTGAYYDSSNSSGSAGQVLASVSGATDWVSLSEISGVDGTGAANQVTFWSDADTITGNDQLQWDGSRLTIIGALEATEKSFVIDHPTRPGNKLVYGVLEGPEHAVYCRGRINRQVLELPEEWTGLVDQQSITVQLTPIGKHQNLYVDSVVDNTIVIRNADVFSSRIDAFYFVQGTRKDIKPLQTVRPA